MTSDLHERRYVCPGEEHPIPRSVHLSRLAAFFPKCRDCSHRSDTGQLPPQTVERLQQTERRVERSTLFVDEGVRGVHVNELTRSHAGRLAAAMASLLWDDVPRSVRASCGPAARRRARPVVVVGRDERPASLDLSLGVLGGLRRMGCHVIDIGLATRPCFRFAVDHLQASAGIVVTGAGWASAWSGLDFVGPAAEPWSRGGRLDCLQQRFERGFSRPTRRGGDSRVFQAIVPYEASLWKHVYGLRPLRVCCGSATKLSQRLLARFFSRLPCELIDVDVANRVRHLESGDDPDVRRLVEATRRHAAHLGVLIDDDAERSAFFDEQGRLIERRFMDRLLIQALLAEHPGATVVIESAALDELGSLVDESGGRCVPAGSTDESIARSMNSSNAIGAVGRSGRHWFRESFPACDAVLVLCHVLQILSRHSAPFSDVLRREAGQEGGHDE